MKEVIDMHVGTTALGEIVLVALGSGVGLLVWIWEILSIQPIDTSVCSYPMSFIKTR